MRQNQNIKRSRGQRRKQGGNVNRALDSTGPDVKIRGTAMQIYEKYMQLSRDAQSAGDRIRAENLLQHAEHYFRIIRAMQPSAAAPQHESSQQDPMNAKQPKPSAYGSNGSAESPSGAAGAAGAAGDAGDAGDAPSDAAPAGDAAASAERPAAEQAMGGEERRVPRAPRRRRPRRAGEEANGAAGAPAKPDAAPESSNLEASSSLEASSGLESSTPPGGKSDAATSPADADDAAPANPTRISAN